jgi:hypothetical protein
MRLTPKDIELYSICSRLFEKKEYNRVNPQEDIFFQSIKKAFILGEEQTLLKDTSISVKKLLRAWDNIWWPLVIEKNIDAKKAQEKTLIATNIFIDYCNYEFSDITWPTLGTNIQSEKKLKQNILVSNIDIIKTNTNIKQKNTVLLNISNRNQSIHEMALNNLIKSYIYPYYSGRKENIIYINLFIDQKNEKVIPNIGTFYPEDINNIEKTLDYISYGIYYRIKNYNYKYCKECKSCQEFKF